LFCFSFVHHIRSFAIKIGIQADGTVQNQNFVLPFPLNQTTKFSKIVFFLWKMFFFFFASFGPF